MKGTWKQMNPKVWVLIPFDVVRYVVRTSFGRRSKQLTVFLQNPTGKIYMWWITGVPIWHACFLLYLIPLWRCFGSCVHKVFPHLSHSKACQNRVCRTSASHWGWPCFWSTYLTSWSNGVPMRFDTILLNWSTSPEHCTVADLNMQPCALRPSQVGSTLWQIRMPSDATVLPSASGVKDGQCLDFWGGRDVNVKWMIFWIDALFQHLQPNRSCSRSQ